MDLAQFIRIMSQDYRLEKEDQLILGVSGGPDSLCLLDLCIKAGYSVVVGHMNHQLRKEADEEERKVIHICQGVNIPYVVERADIREYARQQHLSIEESARKLRYGFLFTLAKSRNAKAVLVAHNQDDQVETILMHLLRGSGMKGLRGMDYSFLPNEWSDDIPLIRPLLGISKVEILDYCTQNNLKPAFDHTNNDTTFFRNKLRKELVPYLESLNRGVRRRLLDMANVLHFEDNYLQQIANNTIPGVVTEKGSGYFVINRASLAGLHPAIIRRILLSIMKCLNPESNNIGFASVQKAMDFLINPSKSSKTELSAHLEMSRYLKDYLLISDVRQFPHELWPQVNLEKDLPLKQGNHVSLNDKWYLTVHEELLAEENSCWRARLDADKITELGLSSFKNGDRFSPLGMGGEVLKLGDYWTNQGLPIKARENWPLIRSGEDIVWVPGFTISENYKISDSTQESICLEISKNNKEELFPG